MQSGPDSAWLDQLTINLSLVMEKYTGEKLISITTENKEAADLLNKQVFLILLMHDSYGSAAKYMKYLERISGDGKLKVGRLARIDTSQSIAAKVPDSIVNASSIELYESESDSDNVSWFNEDGPDYWARLLDLAAEVKEADEPPEEVTGKMDGKII